MAKRETLKDYFHFSRKDRVAAACLAVVLGVLFALPWFLPKGKGEPVIKKDSALMALLDTMDTRAPRQNAYPEDAEKTFFADRKKADSYPPPFPFDPNTLDAAGWQKLGLREKTAQTIIKYRSKGGHFRKPEDLSKIWGLPKGFYERVAAYIRIENSNAAPAFAERPKPVYEKRSIKTIAVNASDSAGWEALPGIGQKLASRIVGFRERLGGFHSVEQVAETYGLPDSTFQKVKPYLHIDGNGIRKLSLNTATEEQLKMHPYIRWKLASLIVAYRKQHGNFNSVDDLKKIEIVDDALLEKLRPYLEL
jgi:competence protein ComEA